MFKVHVPLSAGHCGRIYDVIPDDTSSLRAGSTSDGFLVLGQGARRHGHFQALRSFGLEASDALTLASLLFLIFSKDG